MDPRLNPALNKDWEKPSDRDEWLWQRVRRMYAHLGETTDCDACNAFKELNARYPQLMAILEELEDDEQAETEQSAPHHSEIVELGVLLPADQCDFAVVGDAVITWEPEYQLLSCKVQVRDSTRAIAARLKELTGLTWQGDEDGIFTARRKDLRAWVKAHGMELPR